MQKYSLSLAVILLVLLAGCRSKSNNTGRPSVSPERLVRDTTIYGVATDNFGMSTFSVRTADGREISLVRTRDDGTDATILGDLRPGDDYALTTTDNGRSLVTAVNLTEVRAHAKGSFRMVNAHLVLNAEEYPDTVEILKLDGDSLVARGRQIYRLGRH